MLSIRNLIILAFSAAVLSQEFDYQPAPRPAPARIQPGYSGPVAPKPTPVAILKQINRHNEDGSYTYGYEGADGAFKIETKLPTGEVKGKYGYVDDTGKLRVVEYGATKYGFQPAGEGITVAPPTLVDETTNRDGSVNPQYSGSYYEEEPQPQPIRVAAPRPRPRPQPSFESFSVPQFNSAPQRSPSPAPSRLQIPGAAPVSHQDFDFGPSPSRSSSRSFSPAPRPEPVSFGAPAPIEDDNYEPAPIRSSPRVTYAQSSPLSNSRPVQPKYAPEPQTAPQYVPRQQFPSLGRSGGGGILDQLSKDYALPQGGAAPLHDISFGYY